MYGRLQGDNRYVLMFIVGAAFLLIGAFVGTRENELDRVERDGTRLDAWVVGTHERTRRSSGSRSTGSHKTTDYYINVRFTGPDGRAFEGSRQVSSGAFDHFEYASPEAPIATTVIMDAGGQWYAQPELDYQDRSLTLATAGCVGFGLLMILLAWHTHHKRKHPGQPVRSLYTDQPPGADARPVGRAPGPL